MRARSTLGTCPPARLFPRMLACPSPVHHPLASSLFLSPLLPVRVFLGWLTGQWRARKERLERESERAGAEGGGLVGGRAHDQDNDDDSCYAEVPPPLPPPPQSTVVEAAAATYF